MLSSQFIKSILTTPCIDTCKPFRDPYHFLKLNFDFRILTLKTRKLLLMKRETELTKLFSSTSHLYTQISAEFEDQKKCNSIKLSGLPYNWISPHSTPVIQSTRPLCRMWANCQGDKLLGIISNFRKEKENYVASLFLTFSIKREIGQFYVVVLTDGKEMSKNVRSLLFAYRSYISFLMFLLESPSPAIDWCKATIFCNEKQITFVTSTDSVRIYRPFETNDQWRSRRSGTRL